MTMYYKMAKIDKGQEWIYIVLLVGEEGSLRWNNLGVRDRMWKDITKVCEAFEGNLEKSGLKWQCRNEYLWHLLPWHPDNNWVELPNQGTCKFTSVAFPYRVRAAFDIPFVRPYILDISWIWNE